MFQIVSTLSGLKKLLARVKGPCALDFETTSLHPRDGYVRLASIANGKVKAVVDFHKIKGGFAACADLFDIDGVCWIVFNAGFELRWFFAANAHPTIMDVGYIRRAKLGGGGYSLAQCCEWDLKVTMDKELQASDWSAESLSKEQFDYSYLDADLTWRLYEHWVERTDPNHMQAAHLFQDMVPAIIEMEDTGMLVDQKYHRSLIKKWEKLEASKVQTIRKHVSETEVANINSLSQWSDFLARVMPDNVLKKWDRTEKTGQLSTTTEVLRRVAASFRDHPPLVELFDALADYKTLSKYLSSFGHTLITQSDKHTDKRVRARYNIGRAKTGRFSSSGPNLQQIPRDRELLGEHTSVRRSFVAGPGRKLVSLDYSGIELRVLALLAEDDQLLTDVVDGDVHAEVASVIAGAPIDKTTPEGKAARTAAKAVSFGIIYGSGAGGLSVTMRCEEEEAQGYIDFWAKRYPKAFDYRHTMMGEATRTGYIRVVDGGTIYMGRTPELPRCANYPVQRAALSVMAKAIKRHKDTLDGLRQAGHQRTTHMVSTIHDALIDDASSRDALKLLEIMHKDMIDGYLDVFPNGPTEDLVEGGIGDNWGKLN